MYETRHVNDQKPNLVDVKELKQESGGPHKFRPTRDGDIVRKRVRRRAGKAPSRKVRAKIKKNNGGNPGFL